MIATTIIISTRVNASLAFLRPFKFISLWAVGRSRVYAAAFAMGD
jgi:hypothetical protein